MLYLAARNKPLPTGSAVASQRPIDAAKLEFSRDLRRAVIVVTETDGRSCGNMLSDEQG
jgi:hypothetical protein